MVLQFEGLLPPASTPGEEASCSLLSSGCGELSFSSSRVTLDDRSAQEGSYYVQSISPINISAPTTSVTDDILAWSKQKNWFVLIHFFMSCYLSMKL